MKIDQTITLEDLAGLVAEHLRHEGIESTLVGRAVVWLYAKNDYPSKDLDFISPNDHAAIIQAMAKIGFKPEGKDFVHKDCPWTVEFPTGPLAIGNENPVKAEGSFSTKTGVVQLFSPTQCVMDRLAWFYHNNDRQCLDQALAVAAAHPIKLEKIKQWSAREGRSEKYEQFLRKLKILKA
ncbi:MAG: hypothetical protein KF789_12260 [Bdellovibrionaceae bacterium]|nr:hypothetical protein [Pseudobdellovibrionaceae bacterium]